MMLVSEGLSQHSPLYHDVVELRSDVEVVPDGHFPHSATHAGGKTLPPQLSAFLVCVPARGKERSCASVLMLMVNAGISL